MRPFLFFDVGGTLLHFRPSFAERFGEACRALGVEPGPGGWAAAVEAARAAVGGVPDSVDVEANRRWWRAFYGEFFARHGLEAGERAAASLWAQHRAGDWLTPAEDTIPTLERLAAAGHRMGIISNWDDTLEEILTRRRLLGFFEVVVTSSSARVAKPHAEIFRAALEVAGVPPAAAVHVGDDPVADVEGARAAGLRPVLIGPPPASDAAGTAERISTLSEILALPGIGE